MIIIDNIYVYKKNAYIVHGFPLIKQGDDWVKGVLYKGKFDPINQTNMFVRTYEDFESKFIHIDEVLKGTN